MAQKGVQLDRETFSCSICLDLLKDPVVTPCGHSYCMKCIKGFWDGEDEKKIHSCPQCRQSFTPRPVLLKNTMLAALVEELKKTGLQAAPADLCYAGAEDVACDVCTGRKLRACKSCLVCLASYCDQHLQPHYDVAPLKEHKLVEPSKKLQENICSHHDEVMKMFCRAVQRCICHLCSVDGHKGHDTVSAAAERTERQRELEGSRQNIQQSIQDREKEVKLLQQEVEAVNGSADKAVEDSEKMLTELIRLMAKRSSDVRQQVRSHQKSEVSRVKELQEKLEQEMADLKRRDTTRAGFLKYSQEITLDPNTANTRLLLSEGSRKAAFVKLQFYSSHPDRFTNYPQVLSRESLTGCCYWEVERRGREVRVAVAYKNISRAGYESLFGFNDKSWTLDCNQSSYLFRYNSIYTPVSGPRSSRVGVYLDHRAGILSFYSISETMTLLHRVQTTFTQPLHAGVWLCDYGTTAEFCKLK
ncbi:E3 ubiquitin/ISG15 ligase TRIM25-like [Trematomus bernacchii]|uniref:E3 ubiquitin/ISG15 ligase TRIM25-like n=1 Tax=Trematomus bernacchii TaxID=40690 RepID=UPI00146EE464|nr:E3 ubiquitin/ISG15 ligase TRIM25-like [Trematomus bernacchii]